jgi:hypothetical protein
LGRVDLVDGGFRLLEKFTETGHERNPTQSVKNTDKFT